MSQPPDTDPLRGVPPELRAQIEAAAAGEPEPADAWADPVGGGAAAAVEHAPDYEVLFPDVSITLRGESVTVREYSFVEGLQAASLARGLLRDLGDLFLDADQSEPDLGDIEAVMGAHAGVVVELIALATDRPAEWVGALPDADGQRLLLTWWAVHRDFFGRRLAARAVSRRRTTGDATAASAPRSRS